MKKRDTFTSLVLSMLSIVLSMAMLAGTTFAWFTVSVTSGNNIIASGNLHVKLEYSHDGTDWKTVDANTNIFQDIAEDGQTVTPWKWEPGHTRVVYLRVTNTGSMALKYRLGIYKEENETLGETDAGNPIKLSEFIEFGVVFDLKNPFTKDKDGRDAAREAVKDTAVTVSKGYSSDKEHPLNKEYLLENKDDTSGIIALVVYMSEDAGADANPKEGSEPKLNLGIKLIATQLQSESDSFGNDYDKETEYYPIGADERVDYLFSVGYAKVKDANALADALKEGKNVVLANDITVDNSVLTAAEGTVIDGNGNKIIGLGTDNEYQGLQLAKNVEYRNIEFALEKGWGVITKSAKFINCTFDKASPYLAPAEGDDIVVDGCTLVDTVLQICYNEGGKKPEACKTIITNNNFVVNNTDAGVHAIVLGGGSSEFWANGAETVTMTGNTFTPKNPGSTYIAYYIYGDKDTTLTSVPVYSENTFNGNANYSMNGVATEKQYPLSRESVEVEAHTINGVDVNLTNESYNSIKYHDKDGYTDKIYSIELWSKADLVSALKLINVEVICHNITNDIHPKLIFKADINFGGDIFTGLPYNIDVEGNRHTLSNVKFVGDSENNGWSGFIPHAGNNRVNGLTIKDATSIGAQAGIFAGNTDNVKLTNCALAGNITVTYANAKLEEYNGVGAVFGVVAGGTCIAGVDVANANIMIKTDGITYPADFTAETTTNLVGVVYGGSYTIE